MSIETKIYCEECGNEISEKSIVCNDCLKAAQEEIADLQDNIDDLKDENKQLGETIDRLEHIVDKLEAEE